MSKTIQILNYKDYYDLSHVALNACEILEKERYKLIKTAFGYTNFKIFRTENKQLPIAYILWAEVSQESYSQLIKFGRLPQYDYEWVEGSYFIVMDLAIAKGWKYSAIPLLRQFLRKQSKFAYKRNNKIKIINQSIKEEL